MNIKEILEALDNALQDRFPLNEMSNYRKGKYNLPVNIWIDGPRNLQHGKRIKFQNNYSDKFDETDLLTMTISDDPKLGKTFKKVKVKQKDIDTIRSWVILNKDILLEYSEGNMASDELSEKLKSL